MSEQAEALAKIEAIRKQIDEADKKLVALLNERSSYSLAIRKLKPAAGMQSVYDPKREQEILERICAYNEGPMQDENLKELYSTLLKVMKEVPARD